MPQQHPKGVKTVQDLAAGITPMLPGQPERIPWTWFDTQTYVSGTTTRLDFFQSVQADKNLGNMVAAGQIPSPQFFDVYHCSIAYLLPSTASAIIAAPTNDGAIKDVRNLSAGAASFQIANKEYWSGKQFALPCGGGPVGNLAVAGTFAAPNLIQREFANNGVADLRNRYNFWGDITIPHNQNFIWILTWSAPITLANGNTPICVWMDGYLYRRVL
jgi:hypothetical protein